MQANDWSDADGVLFRTENGIARATLNRPEAANALHGPALEALARAVRAAAADRRIRALVLDGAGKHFCAGADINWMLDARDDSRNLAATRTLSGLLLAIRRLPKPVIARAHGACAGGGAGLCAAADIVVADAAATFAFREVKLGIIPATIAPYVVERIGPAMARRLFITGERAGARDAASMGLVDHVAESRKDASDKVEEILEGLRECGPNATGAAKRLVDAVAFQGADESVAEQTAKLLMEIRTAAEAREGLAAFLQKRRPNWFSAADEISAEKNSAEKTSAADGKGVRE